MPNEELEPLESTGPSKLRRFILFGGAGVAVLVVIAYFVISSSAFFKSVILPRVSKALKADVTVATASLSPFSRVELTKLKVQTPGAEPILTAEQVRVRYGLLSILRGNYIVDELTVISPIIHIVKETNGTSNVDALTASESSKSSETKSGSPLRVAVRNFTVKDALIQAVQKSKDGSVQTTEISHLDLAIDRIENGQNGKLQVGTSLKLDSKGAPTAAATNDVLEGKVTGNLDFKLGAKLLPETLTGTGRMDFSRGAGTYAGVAGLGGTFQADLTPTSLRQFALRFEQNGQAGGVIQASGPLDLSKPEGRLKVEVQSIDRHVLNLFGAGYGWDFANSTLNSTNDIDIARNGEVIVVKGQVHGRQIGVRHQGQTTPLLEMQVDYEVSADLHDQVGLVRKMEVLGRQDQRDLVRGTLDRPMTLTWAQNARGFAESTFQVNLTQLNLKDWSLVLGTNLPAGKVDLQLRVLAQKDGKRLSTKISANAEDLSVRVGTNQLDHAQVNFSLDSLMENFKTVDISQYQLEVLQQNQRLLKAEGTVHYNLAGGDFNVQANAEGVLPALLRQFPVAQLSATNGVVRLSSAFNRRAEKQSATGNLFLGDFGGRYGEYAFQDLQATIDYGVDLDRSEAQIHSVALTLRDGYTAAGSISVSGHYNLEKGTSQLAFKVVDLNQNVLDSILAPSLGDKKLVSVSLSGSGSTTYDPLGDAAIQTDLSVTNWVVNDPRQRTPSPSLSGRVVLDTTLQKQVLDVRQCLLKWAPTARAKNELEMKARINLAASNAAPSQLTVKAESLDFTPYYDLFAGNSSANATASTPAPPPAAKPVEPPPARLPVQQLNADINIGRLFLREVAVTNFETAAKLNRGEVTIKPIKCTVNGKPLQGEVLLNLGVPGYTYDISLQLDRIPMEPLTASFTTNPPSKGDLSASAHLKGAGVTGVSMQKNLTGALALNLTNMTYEIVGKKTKRLLEPIALVLQIPELTQTPINWVGAKAQIGQGKIEVEQFTVQSQAFLAESRGPIPIADVLTNSPLNLPVTLSLRRGLAEKAHLLQPNTPTNALYAALPNFVTLKGTLGDPKSEINKLVIGGLLARSIGNIPNVGKDAGNILQGLGGVLSGQGGAKGSTNAPAATNASPAVNLVEGIAGLLGRSKKASPATNAPANVVTNKPVKPTAPERPKTVPEKK